MLASLRRSRNVIARERPNHHVLTGVSLLLNHQFDTQDAVIAALRRVSTEGGAIGVGGDDPERPVRSNFDSANAPILFYQMGSRRSRGHAVLNGKLPQSLTAQCAHPKRARCVGEASVGCRTKIGSSPCSPSIPSLWGQP